MAFKMKTYTVKITIFHIRYVQKVVHTYEYFNYRTNRIP